jgi:hypothetical protein
MPEIVFTTRLTTDDWDGVMHGWRCQVLNVPGAIVEDIYLEGNRVETTRYEVLSQQNFIRWAAPDQPQRVAATIKLTEMLSLDRVTERWRRLAIILPVLATLLAASISAVATYFAREPGTHGPGNSASAISSTHGPSQLTCEPDIDLNGMDYDSKPASDLASCLKDCRSDPECKAYTFVPPGRNYAGCWLKTTRPPSFYAPGLMSGSRAN